MTAAEAERARRRLLLLELAFAPLDLELAACDVGGTLAQHAFELVDLDEVLGAVLVALLGKPAREREHLLAVELLLLRPADRLPRVLVRLHDWNVA